MAVFGMRTVDGLTGKDNLEIELPVATGEDPAACRLGDDDPVRSSLGRRPFSARRAHLLVYDGVQGEAPPQGDARASDSEEGFGHGGESGLHVTGAASVDLAAEQGRLEGVAGPSRSCRHGVEMAAERQRRAGGPDGGIQVGLPGATSTRRGEMPWSWRKADKNRAQACSLPGGFSLGWLIRPRSSSYASCSSIASRTASSESLRRLRVSLLPDDKTEP